MGVVKSVIIDGIIHENRDPGRIYFQEKSRTESCKYQIVKIIVGEKI